RHLVLDWRGAGVRAIHRLGRGAWRPAAVVAGYDVGRRARDARRDVRCVHGQHDVRRAGEAVLVSPGVDVALYDRAGCTPSRQLVRVESPGRAGARTAV